MSVGLTYVEYATHNPNVFSMMFAIAGKMPVEALAHHADAVPNAYQILQNALKAWIPSLNDQDLEVLSFALWSNVHGLSEIFNKELGPDTDKERKARARAVCKVALDGCESLILAQSPP